MAYAYMPQDGDGEIVVRNIATGVDWRAPRGYRPPVPPPDDPGTNLAEFQAEQARLLRPVFTADSRFLVFGIEPAKAELNKAKKEKEAGRDAEEWLGIMDLKRHGHAGRKSENFPRAGRWLRFHRYLVEAKAGRETEVIRTKPGDSQQPKRPRLAAHISRSANSTPFAGRSSKKRIRHRTRAA